jgi:hypothetical protein
MEKAIYEIAFTKLNLLFVMKNNYPEMKKFDSSFKASLEAVKDKLEIFNIGALQLREAFDSHLTEIKPWVHSLNAFTYNASILIFIGTCMQIILLISQSIPKYTHFKKYNWFLWIASFASLTAYTFALHFQGNFASVNHDVCLLFNQNVSNDHPLPKSFIPESLHPLIDVCVHNPEHMRNLD